MALKHADTSGESAVLKDNELFVTAYFSHRDTW
jgi:hypothetical protein